MIFWGKSSNPQIPCARVFSPHTSKSFLCGNSSSIQLLQSYVSCFNTSCYWLQRPAALVSPGSSSSSREECRSTLYQLKQPCSAKLLRHKRRDPGRSIGVDNTGIQIKLETRLIFLSLSDFNRRQRAYMHHQVLDTRNVDIGEKG